MGSLQGRFNAPEGFSLPNRKPATDSRWLMVNGR